MGVNGSTFSCVAMVIGLIIKGIHLLMNLRIIVIHITDTRELYNYYNSYLIYKIDKKMYDYIKYITIPITITIPVTLHNVILYR